MSDTILYRHHQVALIQRLAKERGWSSLEALTIDRCQGRDKDVVLVSMVRFISCSWRVNNPVQERSCGRVWDLYGALVPCRCHPVL